MASTSAETERSVIVVCPQIGARCTAMTSPRRREKS